MDWLFLLIILIFSVVIHEIAHGAMANALGDSTAKLAGRLSLNPLKHLDPVGSVLLPGLLILLKEVTGTGIIIGWAKPVPVNPLNFRNRKFDSAKVAIAGPATNLGLALVFGLSLRLISQLQLTPDFFLMFSYIIFINILLAVFNLLPIPPLDGSHILFLLLPSRLAENAYFFLNQFGLIILILIIVFYQEAIRWLINFIYTLIVGTPLF